MRKAFPIWVILTGASLLFIGVTIWSSILEVAIGLSPAFDSDEYLHVTPAHDLAIFLSRGDLGSFFQRLQAEVFYPPLHPLLLSILFFLFGSISALARAFSVLLFFGAIFLSYRAAIALFHEKEDSQEDSKVTLVSIGFMTVLAALLSPAASYVSTLVMLEPLGIFLVSLILYFTVRSDFRFSSSLFLGLLLFLLAVSKHTFPLLLCPGLILASMIGDNSEEKIFGKRERTLLAAFALFFILWACWGFSVEERALYRFLFGHHARGYAVGWGENFYYFKSFFGDYFFFSLAAVPLLTLAVLGFITRFSHFSVRFAGLSLLFSALLFGFIAERSPRHLIALAPLLWFLVGIGWGVVSGWIGKRAWLSQAAQALLTTALAISVFSNSQEIQAGASRFLEVKPGQDELLLELRDLITPKKSYLLIGDEILFFPYHLNWLVASRDNLTIPEARTLRKTPSKDFERELRAIDISDKEQVLQFLRKAQKAKQFDQLVVIKKSSASHANLYDGVKTFICKSVACRFEEGELHKALQLENENLRVLLEER